MNDHEARLRRQVAVSKHDPSNSEASMAWACDEIDCLRARVAELESTNAVWCGQLTSSRARVAELVKQVQTLNGLLAGDPS